MKLAHFLFVPLLLLAAPNAFSQNQLTALQVDLLIDGSGKEPVRDAVILIEGKRIKAAGPKSSVDVPKNTKVVRIAKGTAYPGLIDTHAHYKDWQGELYLNHGVTTALVIGSDRLDWMVAQRDGTANGKIIGPRLFVAGPHFNSPRPGERERSIRDLQAQRREEISVATPEEARKAVQELLASGADIVKIYEYSTPEVIKVLTEEAHKQGKPAGGHSEDIFMSVNNGYDFVEHNYAVIASTIKDPKKKEELFKRRAAFRNRMTTVEFHYYAEEANFDELIKFMVEHKTTWTPTMATFWRFYSPNRAQFKEYDMKLLATPNLTIPPYFKANILANHEGVEKLADPELLGRIRTGYGKLQEFIRRYVKAGGKIRSGSDPNSILPAWSVHVEMQLLTEAGLTPLEAILSATRNNAELIRRDGEIGVIKPGALADIVVVEGNPLEDIRKTRNIKMVFKEGAPVKLGYTNYKNPIPLLEGDRPPPEVDKITPSSVPIGAQPVQLTVEGANFMISSVAMLNGRPLPTQVEIAPRPYPQNFDRGTKLTATIDPKLIQKPGTYSITVMEPGPGGITSNAVYMIVRYP
ncbi:MAG TPA: amidohydrolase family protein [Candidatus Binatia bacterium]|jgi:imidazolonepropionase-like amidohydrolase